MRLKTSPRLDPDAPAFPSAQRFVWPLVTATALALLLTLTALIEWRRGSRAVVAPVVAYGVLLTAVFATTAWVVRLRWKLFQAAARHQPPDAPGAHPSAPPGEEPAEAPGPDVRAEADLVWFARHGVALTFGLGGAVSLALSGMALAIGFADQVASTAQATLIKGGLLCLLGLVFRAAAYGTAQVDTRHLPEAPGLARWLDGGQWLAFLLGGAFLGRGAAVELAEPARWVALGLLAACAAAATEMVVRGLARFYGRAEASPTAEVPVGFLLLSALLHDRNRLDVLVETAEERLGLSFRSTWTLGFLRRSLTPVALAVALTLWASTALVVIGPEEQGLRYRFGRLTSRSPLEPGLTVKLPWPLETIDRYPVRRAQTLALGYAGPQKTSLLWAESHAGQEYRLLLGDGRELVSVDAVVTYRIRNVAAHALAFQNPRETLEALAYRRLMQDTVPTNLDRLLSVDRDAFADGFARRLQEACDTQELGIEILHVGFGSLHPPVDVARAYQEVVSAQVEQETRRARARAARARMLPAADAEAEQAVRRAEAGGVARRADAAGGAVRFESLLGQYRTAPELFRFRRRLETAEEALPDLTLYVVDQTLRSRGGELWIDLRAAPPTR
jgi:regulator of protease activity HflC (stomatin/prohibitin superfamily)